jgi:hypothetical protein
MEENTLVESSVSVTINAPIENVDIPSWCFTLSEAEYQGCSPAHCSPVPLGAWESAHDDQR